MTTTDSADTRKARGTSSPVERSHRAYAALRGLAADVYESQNESVTAAYGPALDALKALETAFKQAETPTA